MKNTLILLSIIGFSLAALNVFMFFANWGGDPEIHIIFAKNLLNGKGLQFNPGEYTSGETSILYMTILAAFSYMIGPETLPWIMKPIGVTSIIIIYSLISKIKLFRFEIISVIIYLTCIPSIAFRHF